ncbi:MAG: IS256 family transposase [Spirochaetes bacterium]|nr:IS256 family transposase [Spirochaetota bacterium]
MTIKPEIIDELLKNYSKPEDITGENGLLKQLTKAVVERAMQAEITNHLGYSRNDVKNKKTGNSRNGKSSKTVITDQGNIEIEVPRDREGEYEPKIIKKHERRFTGFDDKILSMYSRGMTTRDIQEHLKDIYGVDVSPDLISDVTDAVIKEVEEWQNRPLSSIYPVVYFDALVVKVRSEGQIKNKSVYLALGINLEGQKEALGMWIEENEGAKFWLKVITELKNRGLNDILIACIDGLKGFEEAVNSVYPNAEIQLCIVHMIRNSLKFVSYKDRKKLVADLKMIYQAASANEAEKNLIEFENIWDKKYPMIGKSWRNNWSKIITFFEYTGDIRRVIYTTNAIESLNMSLRKVIKGRPCFPTDEAVLKLLYMGLKNVSKKWTMPIQEWGLALNQLMIKFEGKISFTQNF